LLLLALQTGLRLSELVSLTRGDVVLSTGAHVHVIGKGRKERCTPLKAPTVAAVRRWLSERDGTPQDPLFRTRQGNPLSPDAVQALTAKYHRLAARDCPSLAAKHVTPHTLRHTCAMNLLHASVDTATIALWLGHESIKTTMKLI